MTGSEAEQSVAHGENAPLVSAAKDKELSPAARRALREAEKRRADADRERQERPKELHGRDGPDPVRYGDWEKKGIASDF
jgi:hypothetical protein